MSFTELDQYVADGDKLQRKVIPAMHSEPAAGCKKMHAILGPDSLKSGTTANSNLPNGINAARRKYPSKSKLDGGCFRAGHMLNQGLGGDGHEANNLTILTASANSAMIKYDSMIKNAVAELERLYRNLARAKVPLADIELGKLCIDLVVEAVGKWGPKIPDCYIAEKIEIKAKFSPQAISWDKYLYIPPDTDENLERSYKNIFKKYEKSYNESCAKIAVHLAGVSSAEVDNSQATIIRSLKISGGKPNKGFANKSLGSKPTIAKKASGGKKK